MPVKAELARDAALIWMGNQQRPRWTKELFRPYVVNDYADGHRSWLFDGFIFLEGNVWNEDYSINYTFGEANLYPAGKQQWSELLDHQLGLDTGNGCKALDDVIGELIPELGAPASKHKVILMMCIPYGYAGNWGSIGDKKIDFAKPADKIEAMKWYTDQILERWEKAAFKNIELDGIYWLREAASNYEMDLAKPVTDYAHEKGLNAYWIPYFNATNFNNWEKMGIDMAYIQPNYFFTTDKPLSRLDDAINTAYENEMGLELEFEGNYVSGYDPVHNVIPQPNTGLYDVSPVYYQRFVDYLDKFEEYDVFEFMNLSYYSGYQGVYDFAKSTNPKDRKILDRLASHIERRHIINGWYTPKPAGITDLTVDGRRIAYVDGSNIRIPDRTQGVAVYTTDGRLIYQEAPAPADFSITSRGLTIPCQKGIYIVRVGPHTLKLPIL